MSCGVELPAGSPEVFAMGMPILSRPIILNKRLNYDSYTCSSCIYCRASSWRWSVCRKHRFLDEFAEYMSGQDVGFLYAWSLIAGNADAAVDGAR